MLHKLKSFRITPVAGTFVSIANQTLNWWHNEIKSLFDSKEMIKVPDEIALGVAHPTFDFRCANDLSVISRIIHKKGHLSANIWCLLWTARIMSLSPVIELNGGKKVAGRGLLPLLAMGTEIPFHGRKAFPCLVPAEAVQSFRIRLLLPDDVANLRPHFLTIEQGSHSIGIEKNIESSKRVA